LRFITVTELRAQAPKIISEIENSGEEVVITKNGKPTTSHRPPKNAQKFFAVSIRRDPSLVRLERHRRRAASAVTRKSGRRHYGPHPSQIATLTSTSAM